MVITNSKGKDQHGLPILPACTYITSGNPIKCHEEVLCLQPMFPPKRFDIFSLYLEDAQKAATAADVGLYGTRT